MNARVLGKQFARWAGIAVILLIALFPFYWIVTTALIAGGDLFTRSPSFVPNFENIDIFARIFEETTIGQWLSNSLVIAAGTTFFSLVAALFAAYALSRYRFRGKQAFGFSLFVTQMLPEALLVIPLYALFITLVLRKPVAWRRRL